jgi:hypothetical protein
MNVCRPLPPFLQSQALAIRFSSYQSPEGAFVPCHHPLEKLLVFSLGWPLTNESWDRQMILQMGSYTFVCLFTNWKVFAYTHTCWVLTCQISQVSWSSKSMFMNLTKRQEVLLRLSIFPLGLNDGSVVKSMYSCTGLGRDSQHPPNGSQPLNFQFQWPLLISKNIHQSHTRLQWSKMFIHIYKSQHKKFLKSAFPPKGHECS